MASIISILRILSTFDHAHFVLIWQISIFDVDFEDTENTEKLEKMKFNTIFIELFTQTLSHHM